VSLFPHPIGAWAGFHTSHPILFQLSTFPTELVLRTVIQKAQGNHILYQEVLWDDREVTFNGSLSGSLSEFLGTIRLQGKWMRGRSRVRGALTGHGGPCPCVQGILRT